MIVRLPCGVAGAGAAPLEPSPATESDQPISIPFQIRKLQVDAVHLNDIRKAGLCDETWQAFAALLPVRAVGVMGDGRTYDQARALRAVTSTDGMTADHYPFDHALLGHVRIINE